MYTLASLVESCLDGITKSETMEVDYNIDIDYSITLNSTIRFRET
jgi:hypothetical protein